MFKSSLDAKHDYNHALQASVALPIAAVNDQATESSDLIDMIGKICPYDNMEKKAIADTIDWIKNDGNIYRIEKPAYPRKHLSTLFVLVDRRENKVFLVDHKAAEKWIPAGGHVEFKENPVKTVEREAFEELGLFNVTFTSETPIMITVDKAGEGNEDTEHTDVNLWFSLEVSSTDTEIKSDDDEFHSAKWFHVGELPDKREPSLVKMLLKMGLVSDDQSLPR
jgi:8-oxo-dGTP pyrophosphatase MutT (NUDIX family)